jgi:hypothetical protein
MYGLSWWWSWITKTMQEARNSAVTTQQAARWHALQATGAAQITHLCCPPPSAELLISFTSHSPRNTSRPRAKLGSFGCLTLLGGIQPKSKQIRKLKAWTRVNYFGAFATSFNFDLHEWCRWCQICLGSVALAWEECFAPIWLSDDVFAEDPPRGWHLAGIPTQSRAQKRT